MSVHALGVEQLQSKVSTGHPAQAGVAEQSKTATQ